ncbi:hypothetical protein NIES2119_05665 [[Phormidium ambiguum] IAM M-71]|uniref:J domain-containing protein n=1 Tax=[Phormidium ambiguum] IAM M-71 TaxID=454136 RepID=A0A1U7IQU8_9CYAN|nr:DnaJ domain-containing protein [Phormidium ambiguum]OKH39736.1 hypothetical protein NIES2119_05665 [Phormidium ambiguum IAM M-71]
MNTQPVISHQLKRYYTILELHETASLSAIKQAYRQLARRYHPDLNPHNKMAEIKFKEINTAYQVLSNLKKNQRSNSLINHRNMKSTAFKSDIYDIFAFALQGKNH